MKRYLGTIDQVVLKVVVQVFADPLPNLQANAVSPTKVKPASLGSSLRRAKFFCVVSGMNSSWS